MKFLKYLFPVYVMYDIKCVMENILQSSSIVRVGPRALASRFKKISEHFYGEVNLYYERQGIDFRAHWFPILVALSSGSKMSINDIATEMGSGHTLVLQFLKHLMARQLVATESDKGDKRKTLVRLTPKGKAFLDQLESHLQAMEISISSLSKETGVNLIGVCDSLETVLARKKFSERILEDFDTLQKGQVIIRNYETTDKEHFVRLNTQWLEKDFVVEDEDKRVFRSPEKEIIGKGGQIFVAEHKGEVIGVCSLIKDGNRLELSKMAVDPKSRGFKVGEKLIRHAINAFEQSKARELYLFTNHILVPAIRLYLKTGFELHSLPKDAQDHYHRADIYMVYNPDKKWSGK
jgi:N-acetylglutamate synthase-like GNAT family acetyltransferase/DNA-binding MarR family transcriptional regulator